MYTPVILNHFKKEAKRYTRKHPELKQVIIDCLKTFQVNRAAALGKNVYKIRLTTKQLRKGKRGGFRLILLIIKTEKQLVPITIYFKGDKENITWAELNTHLAHVEHELEKMKNC